MKGLCRIALAALVAAACGGDSGITGLDEPSTPPPVSGGILALGVDSTTGASIETNKDDYAPGEIVHLVGRGWAPGETVNLFMAEQPNTHADVDTNVVADANGGFDLHFYDVQPHDLGVTFTLTARGQTSHSTAIAVFTDNVPIDVFTLNGASTVTVSPSASINAIVAGAVNNGAGGTTLGSISIRSYVDGTSSSTSVQLICHDVVPNITHLSGAAISYSKTFSVNAPSSTGTYDVFAATYGNDGCTGTPIQIRTLESGIIVQNPNTPPTAEANGPYSGPNNTNIALSGVGSTDVGGSIATYAWTYSVVNAPGGTCTIANASTNSPTGATISCTVNGDYEVTLTVTDNQGATDDDVAVLTISNTAPTANAGGPYDPVAEGSSLTLNGSGNDTDGSITGYLWSWTTVASDAGASCTIADATQATASISCTDDGTFQVKLTVTDDDGQAGEATANINVTNATPDVQANGGSGNEGSAISVSASFDDAGDNDTHPTKVWSYTLGAGAAGTCSFGSSSAQNTTITCTDNGTFNIKYSVTDDDGSTGEGIATVTVANVAPSVLATGGSGLEASAINVSASFTDTGGNDTHPTKLWSYVAGVGAEGTCSFGSSSASSTTITCTDDGTYTIKYSVTDDDGSTGEGTATVIVTNDAPAIGAITAPIAPVPAGNVNVSWLFSDPGADTWTCEIEWDTNAGFSSASYIASPKGCSATRSLTPGLYTVTVKVSDDDGGVDTETLQSYIVVYDPNGGFVTGGGWINSLAGYYRDDPAAAGKANFGFVSKYQPGRTIPTGNTEFQFHAGNLNFKSTSYEWLVVAGAKAIYKGEGTIAGQTGVYGFLLSAIDGSPDKFRIKIWEKTSGNVVYDTLPVGAEDDADPTTTLGGGSIVVHTKK